MLRFCGDNPVVCLEKSHEGIAKEIKHWAMDFNKPLIYWLYGLAAREKSEIARTLLESVGGVRRLGPSFFCSRDSEIKDQSNPKLIFPTLAAYLATKHTRFSSRLAEVISTWPQPDVVCWPLERQMNTLIVTPLLQSGNPDTVIVIDALDECEDKESVKQMLSLLWSFVSEVPNVKLLVTSRPDSHIVKEFTRLAESGDPTQTFVFREVEPCGVGGSIRKLLSYPAIGNLQKLADGQGKKSRRLDQAIGTGR